MDDEEDSFCGEEPEVKELEDDELISSKSGSCYDLNDSEGDESCWCDIEHDVEINERPDGTIRIYTVLTETVTSHSGAVHTVTVYPTGRSLRVKAAHPVRGRQKTHLHLGSTPSLSSEETLGRLITNALKKALERRTSRYQYVPPDRNPVGKGYLKSLLTKLH